MNSINTISHYPDQNVQFKGLNFSRYAKLEERRMVARMSSGILSQDVNNLMELTRHATVRKLNFFRTLTNKYNKENYYRALDQKEDASLVTKIYQAVKSPNENQRAFAREFNGSMENLYKIFQNIQNKTKRLNFAHTINKDILSEQQGSGRLISDLLESENSAEYIKNYTKYRSYLKLNVNDPDAVKNLDKMIKEGTYNPEKYNAIFKTQEIKLKYAYPETENFNHKIFAENYTEEGNILLKFMSFHSYLPKEAFLDGGDKAVLGLFKTANKNNLPLRLELIKNDSNSVFLDKKLSPEVQIKEFKKLFDKIDSDKNVKKFVEDITKKPARILSVAEINHILDNVPALKLNIFSSNAQNIIFQLRDEKEELVKTLLNEIENPFFETRYARINRKHAEKYGVAKKQSFAQKIMQRFINTLRIQRYKCLSAFVSEKKPHNSEVLYETVDLNIEKLAATKNGNDVKIIPETVQKPQSIIETVSEAEKAKEVEENISILPEKIIDTKKISSKNNKQEIAGNIINFVNSRLGSKTFAKQSDLFSANATKIRLSLLPEIFSSIADTRKADRAVGKKRINSSNKDVLELYLLINGSNRKFVNYLLKKRNVDNTRMFEVKEIISMLKKAETKIQNDKKNNPLYRANDARKYYNHLYESKIQQYGKVKRQTKINKNA